MSSEDDPEASTAMEQLPRLRRRKLTRKGTFQTLALYIGKSKNWTPDNEQTFRTVSETLDRFETQWEEVVIEDPTPEQKAMEFVNIQRINILRERIRQLRQPPNQTTAPSNESTTAVNSARAATGEARTTTGQSEVASANRITNRTAAFRTTSSHTGLGKGPKNRSSSVPAGQQSQSVEESDDDYSGINPYLPEERDNNSLHHHELGGDALTDGQRAGRVLEDAFQQAKNTLPANQQRSNIDDLRRRETAERTNSAMRDNDAITAENRLRNAGRFAKASSSGNPEPRVRSNLFTNLNLQRLAQEKRDFGNETGQRQEGRSSGPSFNQFDEEIRSPLPKRTRHFDEFNFQNRGQDGSRPNVQQAERSNAPRNQANAQGNDDEEEQVRPVNPPAGRHVPAGNNEHLSFKAAAQVLNSFRFNGQLTKWPMFQRTVRQVILENDLLSPKQKAALLLSSLEEQPLSQLNSVEASSDDALQIMDRLRDVYDDSNQVRIAFLDAFANQPKVADADDPFAMKRLLSNVRTLLSELHILNIPNWSYTMEVLPLIQSALPDELRSHIRLNRNNNCFDILQILENYCVDLRQTAFFSRRCGDATVQPIPPRNQHDVSRRNPDITVQLNTDVQPIKATLPLTHNFSLASADKPKPSAKKKEDNCYLCNRPGHLLKDCPDYPSAHAKVKKLQELFRCCHCFSTQHVTEHCVKTQTCGQCEGNHYTFLCLVTRPWNRKMKNKQGNQAHDAARNPRGRNYNFRGQGARRSFRSYSPPEFRERRRDYQSTRDNYQDRNRQQSGGRREVEHPVSSRQNSRNRKSPERRAANDERERHHNSSRSPNEQLKSEKKEAKPDLSANQVNLNLLSSVGRTYLMTILIPTEKADGQPGRPLRALLDHAAHSSFVTKTACEGTNWEKRPAGARVEGFNGMPTAIQQQVDVLVLNPTNNQTIKIQCHETPLICRPINNVATDQVTEMLKRNSITVKDINDSRLALQTNIDLLLGAHISRQLETGRQVRLCEGLVAVETVFGWCLSGAEAIQDSTSICCLSTEEADIAVENLWLSEGISDPTHKEAELIIYQQIKESIQLVNHRYWISLPWLCKNHIHNNFNVAVWRLRKLIQQLHRMKQFERYQEALMQYVVDGHAEPVSGSQIRESYYMPHQPVVREDSSSTKLRIVFDPSSHARFQLPLNEHLSKGCNLNPILHEVLLRFRLKKFAAVSDIAKAFLQIQIKEEDRNYLRFLWIDAENSIHTYRMTRVPFGTKSSPFMLASVIRHHLDSNAERFTVANQLRDNIYVDDIILTSNSTSELDEFKQQTCDLFSDCSMETHKWLSSSSELNQRWAATSDSDLSKVLGCSWNFSDDFIGVSLKVKQEAAVVTKRIVLSQLGSFYDPYGIGAPVVIKFKIFMQKIVKAESKNGLSVKPGTWDQPLSVELTEEFLQLCDSLKQTNTFSIPRCVAIDVQRAGLLIFGDASLTAYGSVVYVCDFQSLTITFLTARTRVAPIIPREMADMELQAATLSARLCKLCSSATGISKACLYTDSLNSLNWIQSTKLQDLSVYQRNRVKTITQLTNRSQWFHIPGSQNPADVASRGLSPKALLNEAKWWTSGMDPASITESDFKEINPSLILVAANSVDLVAGEKTFSNWEEVATAYTNTSTESNVQATDYPLIFKQMQRMDFALEIELTHQGKPMPNGSRLHKYVTRFNSAGLLCVRSRIATEDDQFNNPVVLCAKNKYAKFLIKHEHERLGHISARPLITHFRQRFLFIGVSRVAHRIAFKCDHCVRHRTKPETAPLGKLPAFWTKATSAFQNVGIDFFGPLYVRSRRKNQPLQKRYGLMITCAVTRAVHIEITLGMTAKDVWDALLLFIARRRRPDTIYSDNAKAFLRTSQDFDLLQDALQKASTEYSDKSIVWKFTPPLSPWFGGFYERLIGAFKAHLTRTLNKYVPTERELILLSAQIEAVLNSRPIGTVENGSHLTPAHFLIGVPITSPPPVENLKDDEVPNRLLSIVEHQRKIDHFWTAWRQTYLAQLRDRFLKPGNVKQFQPGQNVLLNEPNLKRNDWRQATIVEAIPSLSNESRVYKVSVDGQHVLRSLQLIAPMEIDV